ncbi:hypothetical protein D515_00607 [Grimontia indica]|uniref:Uncharacterized protein n=1 Tax=Grimontia indica TaxID=1056512 RepID=R1GWB5_9GAMM|nr:hypothetical protein D515_00607 [Grimontia indica]
MCVKAANLSLITQSEAVTGFTSSLGRATLRAIEGTEKYSCTKTFSG